MPNSPSRNDRNATTIWLKPAKPSYDGQALTSFLTAWQSGDEAGNRKRIASFLRQNASAYRCDHLRAVAQRIEAIDKIKARIMGSRTALLKTLTAAGAQTAAHGVPTLELKWRTGEDSNSRPPDS